MKITSISYSESREYADNWGLKRWEKVGMEAEVEGDAPEKDLEELKATVKKQFKGEVAMNYSAPIPPYTFYSPPEYKTEEEISHEQKVLGYTEIINMASTKKQLEMHRTNIEKLKDEALIKAFNDKISGLG